MIEPRRIITARGAAMQRGEPIPFTRPGAVAGDELVMFLAQVPLTGRPTLKRLAIHWMDYFTTADAFVGFVAG